MKKIYLAIGSAFTAFTFSASYAQTTQTFSYTGTMQTFVVPPCVTSITVDISGAEGGGNAAVSAPGGGGGRVQATMTVTAGQTLNIFVGSVGDVSGTPGYNGGGSGIGGSAANPGGGGGGASDIRLNGTALADRVIVAGGGGGGTENGGASSGGAGGGLTGGTGGIGGNPWGCTSLTAATGGSQVAGGLGGTSSSCAWNGSNGTLGVGGNTYMVYRSAGGGGGYYGGGGAHNGCSGGGGSSYTNGLFSGVVHTQGYQLGNGLVTLTYTLSGPNPGAITGSSALCSGTTGNYSIVSMPGATSYTWTVPAGSTINSGQGTTSINITAGSTSGNITVTATYTCGISGPTALALTINALPTVTATSTASAVCVGGSVTLSGGGASSYAWSGGVINGVPFVPVSTTTYTVTGTDVNGCVNTASSTVTINPLPTITANSTASAVCAGASVTLTGSGASTYSWSGGVSDGVPFVPISTLNYTVTGTDVNGCVNSATTTVTVNAIPTVVANSTASAVCAGGSVTLSGSGASTYTWTGGVIDAVSFIPTSTNTYTVTGTDANACVNTATTTVTVNPIPIVLANSTSATVCEGSSVTLTGSGATTYVWTGGVTDAVSFIPASTNTYTVTGTDGNGCVNTATITVSVNSNPIVDLGPDTTQCGGGLTLDAGNVGSSYLWNNTTTLQTVVASSSGIYYVDVTNANGCLGSDTVVVTINPIPTVTGSAASTVVCVDDGVVVLTGSPAGGTWSGTGVIGSTFSPSSAGVGTQSLGYSFTDSLGCEGVASISIQVNACVGVVETTLANGVAIFPNPNNGAFTISVDANIGDMTIELVDMNGRMVFRSVENKVQIGFTKQISTEEVSNGVYMLRLMTTSEQRIEKLSVQK